MEKISDFIPGKEYSYANSIKPYLCIGRTRKGVPVFETSIGSIYSFHQLGPTKLSKWSEFVPLFEKRAYVNEKGEFIAFVDEEGYIKMRLERDDNVRVVTLREVR